MKAPGFWSDPQAPAGRLLAPLGAVVGAVTLARMARPGARAGVPVICIGNPTVGGSGKTPATQWLAALATARGLSPAILARGYGGRLAGPVVVDPAVHGPADVGDEPLLHARRFPTVVARDRPAGAALAVARGAGLIVMDDGFQNPALAKDLSVLVVDGAAGLGSGRVLPAGPLRAPFRPQLARADALLVVGEGEAGEALAALAAEAGRPVLRGRLVVEAETAAWLSGRDVLAFCGIGRPAKFVETLGAAGARNAVLRPFADHHAYGEADAERLLAEAARTGLPLVTTEKDAVKLKGSPALDRLAAATRVVPVSLKVEEEAAAAALLDRVTAPRRS
ncbi:tetraacyldisaccharide 4'-kinase [Phreatobacter cathodiphilus]|uniref:Tetraacyldisaccharide 4'-kinase n=1 Tax=Phreatobacter cathodiphilus TaxID=1868589 RepID=A0A2S0NG41_9HYPH|nr:tetraacyldisaccharide 4'-kinase [Phreatobacter cathodiphilus]AVO46901.1 tetraacyldisaccharide 4'-kinase [Phreatobacter cathodiphilus]